MITKEYLKQFCSDDDSRPSIMEPFSEGEHTFATDGRLIVRVARLPDVDVNPSAPKDVGKNIFTGTFDSKTTPLSAFEIPPLEGRQPCGNCRGTGMHYCENCSDDHECRRCEDGKVDERAKVVEIGRQKISHLLLNKIKVLPNVSIAQNASDKDGPMAFFFDGGDGLLMPMKGV